MLKQVTQFPIKVPIALFVRKYVPKKLHNAYKGLWEIQLGFVIELINTGSIYFLVASGDMAECFG